MAISAYNQIDLTKDQRVGPRGVPPIQRNAATQGYATSMSADKSPLQNKKINPITGLPDLGDAMNFSKWNPQMWNYGQPRPQQTNSSVNGVPTNTIPLVPAKSAAPATAPAAAPATDAPNVVRPNPSGPAMGTGQPTPGTPTANQNAEIDTLIQNIMADSRIPEWAKKSMVDRIRSNGQVLNNQYSYAPPAADPRVGQIYDQLMNPSNINVIGGQAPEVGKRFNSAYDQLNSGPDVMSDVMGNMGNFNSNVSVPGATGNGYVMPERGTGYFDAAKNANREQPAAPDRTNPAALPGSIDLQDSATQANATKRELGLSDTLAANAGVLTDQQLNQYLKPFEDRASRIAAEESSKGLGYLNKIGGGGNVDAISKLRSDITSRRLEDVGSRYSELMKQNLAQRPEMLRSAAEIAGNVSGREANTGIQRGNIKLGERGQDVNANISNREISSGERNQDIQVAQSNADRLSKEMLGLSGLDVQKYLGDRGVDADLMKADITKQLQQRGMSLQEAQFKADEFGKAFERSFAVNRAGQADKQYMADLALKADQGDVQAGLTHADQLLKQAVSNGELDQNAAKTLLDDLFQYWDRPQEFALKWRQLRDQYDLGAKEIAANKKKDSLGLGFGPFNVNIPL